jgi:IMP dehydrogenase
MEFSPEKQRFFERMDKLELALTFDDVRMRTRSGQHERLPDQVDITSRFSRNVDLKIPLVSAAMNDVTEAPMAIALAQMGGLGVIHSYLTADEQKNQVRKVKFELTGLIEEPFGYKREDTLEYILSDLNKKDRDFRTLLVKDNDEKVVGVLTEHDFEVAEFRGVTVTAEEAMTPLSEMVYASAGTTIDQAFQIMLDRKKIKTVPLLNENGTSAGLYLWKGVRKIKRGDTDKYNLDDQRRLRVGAAIPTSQEGLERIQKMHEYVDVFVLDSADGDSYFAFETLKEAKNSFPDVDIMAGNISEGESARELVEAGADGIKVGQGPGSICKTRPETGIGMPQITAVYECKKAIKDSGVPVCADGGIVNRGDISLAIAAGAHSVMMGKVLAATDKAPGKIITTPSGARVKLFRGMGSQSNIEQHGGTRYYDGYDDTPIAEGVDTYEPYKGQVEKIVLNCVKALRKSMRYVKAKDIEYHRTQTRFRRITNAGLVESHPHDVNVIS